MARKVVNVTQIGERRAASGEEIVVTKHGEPRFKIVAVVARKARPRPGSVDLGLSPQEIEAVSRVDWFTPDEHIEREFGVRE